MKKSLKSYLKDIWRYPFKRFMKKNLKNESFSIISCNCIGGILYHDLFQKFRSPTINLIIPNFIEFCENLNYYLNLTPVIKEKINNKFNWPEIYLDNIVIYGVHYNSSSELKDKWIERSKRVNFKNIVIIATDNFIKENQLERFNNLNYPKVLFTSKKNLIYEWQVFLPEFSDKKEVGDTLRYTNIFGQRIFEKHFDCVGWLNESINYKS